MGDFILRAHDMRDDSVQELSSHASIGELAERVVYLRAAGDFNLGCTLRRQTESGERPLTRDERDALLEVLVTLDDKHAVEFVDVQNF